MTAQKRKDSQPLRVEPQGPLGHLINDALIRRGRLGRDRAAMLINKAAANDGMDSRQSTADRQARAPNEGPVRKF